MRLLRSIKGLGKRGDVVPDDRAIIDKGYARYSDKKPKKKSVNQMNKHLHVTRDGYPKHSGGSWYELSNGEKVQGKKEAQKAEIEYQNSIQKKGDK